MQSGSIDAREGHAGSGRGMGLPGAVTGVLGALLLLAATAATYGPFLDSPFVFDDDATILHNPSIERLWPPLDVVGRSRPLSPAPGLATSARPLANLTLAVDRARHGTDPAGYRLTNLSIHVAVGLLLWLVTWRTLARHRPRWLEPDAAGLVALAAALAWTVHPVNSECVMYLTQRTESLMALCLLATLACALRYWEADGASRRGWLAAAGSTAVAGMLSKEVMVVAPLVVFLFERTFVSPRGSIPRSSLPLYAALAAATLAVPALHLLGHTTPLAGDVGIPPATWWWTQAKVLHLYAGLMVWPWPLAIHYQMPYLRDVATAWPWVAGAAVFVTAAAWLAWRRYPAGFLATAALCTLAPTSLVPLFDEVAAERRLYLPLAAALVGAVIAPFSRGVRPVRSRDGLFMATLAATFGLALVLAHVSHARARVYRSAIEIWSDNVASQPDNYVARYNLAHSLAAANRKAEALRHYEHAASLPPPSPRHARIHARAAFNAGLLHQEAGDHAAAVDAFGRALALSPDSIPAHYNMARSLEDLGEPARAVEAYRWILDHDPGHYWAHTNLAVLLAARNETDAALAHFQAAHRISDDFLACANLAALYRATGRIDDAVVMARAALGAADGSQDGALVRALADFIDAARRRGIEPTDGSTSGP